MIFKDIDRVLCIIKYGSFSKAAKELYISRSALTQQVKQLENELGFTIFDRNHTGICLTKEGAYFIEEIQKITKNYDQTIDYCCKNQKSIPESIIIGLMPNLYSPFLSDICKEFRLKHPDVEIQFKDFFPKDYATKFQAKEFDISLEYFFNYIHDIKGLQYQKVATTTHCLQVIPNHPLAQLTSIDFEDLRGHKLIMYRRGITKSEDNLRNYIIHNEPEITIIDIDVYDSSLFTKCELENAVLLSYALYDHSFPQFIHIPAKWNIPIHLGFYCHQDCHPIVKEFINVAAATFHANHEPGGSHVINELEN